MINKNNICVIVGSYPQNHLDSALVSLTIESFKRHGYDVCLTSHTPVSTELQQVSKYFIYSDENHILKFPEPSSLAIFHADDRITYQTNNGNKLGAHSYSILINLKNALWLLKNKHYTHFLYVECDTFLNSEDHKILESELTKYQFDQKDYWFMIENQTPPSVVPVTSMFGGNIDFFNISLNTITTPEEYLEVCKKVNAYSLEGFITSKFLYEPTLNGITVNTRPRDLFTSEWVGISSLGNIQIPGLESKFTIEPDIVKEKNGDKIYFVIPNSIKNEKIDIKLYTDDNLVVSNEIGAGPLYYWSFDLGNIKSWRIEIYHEKKLLTQVERTTEEILWNYWSYFLLK
jgi:hypothetical protein